MAKKLSSMEIELLQILSNHNPYSFNDLSTVYLRQKNRSIDKLLMAIELSQADDMCLREYHHGSKRVINPDIFENKMGTDRVVGKCAIRGCRNDSRSCFGGLAICEKHYDNLVYCAEVNYEKGGK